MQNKVIKSKQLIAHHIRAKNQPDRNRQSNIYSSAILCMETS